MDVTSYVFDAFGRMVAKSVGGVENQVLYGPSGMKLALMNGLDTAAAYVRLPGGAETVYGSGTPTAPARVAWWRHPDWLGTSRLMSTPGRAVYDDVAYAPYGATYADDPVAGTDRLFAGQDVLTAPDLYDSQSRRYSPIATRWLSPDPAGMSAVEPENPQSWNRYAYAGGKPLTQIDPDGKDEIAVDFQGLVGPFGHEGVISILSNGAAQYSRLGPTPPGSPTGAGEIQTYSLPSVQFANGVATAGSLKALVDAAAQIEGAAPNKVKINYFKTSDKDTMAMRTTIAREAAAAAHGSGPYCNYNVVTNNCLGFTLSSLITGKAITATEIGGFLNSLWRTVPNLSYGLLGKFASFSIPGNVDGMDEFDLLELLQQQDQQQQEHNENPSARAWIIGWWPVL